MDTVTDGPRSNENEREKDRVHVVQCGDGPPLVLHVESDEGDYERDEDTSKDVELSDVPDGVHVIMQGIPTEYIQWLERCLSTSGLNIRITDHDVIQASAPVGYCTAETLHEWLSDSIQRLLEYDGDDVIQVSPPVNISRVVKEIRGCISVIENDAVNVHPEDPALNRGMSAAYKHAIKLLEGR